MLEISLAHKSHILHAVRKKANYMRVGMSRLIPPISGIRTKSH